MKRIAMMASVAAALSGCYKIDYVRSTSAAGAPTAEEWHHIGLFALVEFSDPVPLQTICPTGFARVHHEISVVNGALTMALGFVGLSWVYQPSTISVYCNSGSAYNVEVDSEGMAMTAQRFE